MLREDKTLFRDMLLEIRNIIDISEETEKLYWPWIGENKTDKKSANKFLAWVIIDYQVPAVKAIENIRKLAESILSDPEDLFSEITTTTLDDWNSKWSEYRLHRFPKAHERLWKIGKRIIEMYEGDARQIWASRDAATTYENMIELGIGEQLSNMALGALMDLELIEGSGDVKADIHVRRVLGRVFEGKGFVTAEKQKAIELAREIYPDNPWYIDRPLFVCGRQICKARNPECGKCPFKYLCQYRLDNV